MSGTRHFCSAIRDYPDGTAVAICACGYETNPWSGRSMDRHNYELQQHYAAVGGHEDPKETT